MVHSGSHISLKQSPSEVDLSRDKHQEGSQGLGAFLHQEARQPVSEGGESGEVRTKSLPWDVRESKKLRVGFKWNLEE